MSFGGFLMYIHLAKCTVALEMFVYSKNAF